MDLSTVKLLFQPEVRMKWEKVLSVYFSDVYFFEDIEHLEGTIRIIFRGNPTSFKTAHHRVHIVFSEKIRMLDPISFSFLLYKSEDVSFHVEFSQVSREVFVTDPQMLINGMHDTLEG
jgi:hypothetical protein